MKHHSLPYLILIPAAAALVLFSTGGPLYAQARQSINIASSPNPVGSGARAMGMGGAFIAVADDATAASWNPAGLTQLKRPECSFALSYFRRREDFTARSHPEASRVQHSMSRDLNYFSIAWPFEFLNRNMIVSLNYQRLYELDRNVDIDFLRRKEDRFLKLDMDYRQRGHLIALSPAYAIEITPQFAVGFTLNIWTDNLFWSNGWESDQIIHGSSGMIGRGIRSRFTHKIRDRYYGFSGINAHIGFLWRINRFITFGGVIKTPFTGELQHEKRVDSVTDGGDFIRRGYTSRIDEDIDLEMPVSYGLGLAVRCSDRLTLSLDLTMTQWSHFKSENSRGERRSPVTGRLSYRSDVHDTLQVRLGAEYLFVFPKTVIPLRFGLFYDPEPSEENPEDYWGFSVGSGISFGPVIIDCAYQYRRGTDVEGDVLDIPGSSADITQHLLMVSMIFHF